ncbi:dihydrolipoyl dehydrogenase [Candidatus Micrarchaeota archaeon]|nr:dihydrolipoyl dehydrogenase [Candidatus Micrarchaeota archaeon]
MVVGEMAQSTDVVVIGAGPGGYVAAIRAAQLGKKVICVESEELGGICLNHGCIPSKAIIHASAEYAGIGKLEELGITVSAKSLNAEKMQAWKEGVLKKLRSGIASLFRKYKIELVKGTASFDSSQRVVVQQGEGIKAIEFERAIIATGSKSVELPNITFDGEFVISSRYALKLQEVPKRLAIVGGGYIGFELGTVFARLGSHVTLVEASAHVLGGLDNDVKEVAVKKLQASGAEIVTQAKAKSADRAKKELVIETVQGEKRVPCDLVLVAVGRKPLTENLRLQNTRVQVDAKGFVKVNEQRRTHDPRIYAIGDVIGHPMLAHKASAEGKVAAEAISGEPAAFDAQAIPAVVYSDPEIASVGMHEWEAQKEGKKIRVGKYFFRALGRAMTMQENDGFVKVIIGEELKEILGIHIVGPNASDLISEATLAIEMGALAEDVGKTIHPHPSLSEAIMEAVENALGKGVHS